jgi:hypothetical protein
MEKALSRRQLVLVNHPTPSSQARLLAPSPLRTVRNTFALHGSSTQQRPLNERGRSLIQVQLRPTRY